MRKESKESRNGRYMNHRGLPFGLLAEFPSKKIFFAHLFI
jgi:hypothetical protein